MIDRSLARRYVCAVHRLAVESGELEGVRGELARLQAAAADEPRVMAVLRHPDITSQEKSALLLRIAGDPASDLMAGFVDVLLRKGRVEVLLGAADVFTQIADEEAGLVRARVEVALEPTADQQERLQQALSRLTGAPVVAEYELAPAALGGARVHVAGRLIDGTLEGKLAGMVARASGVG